MDDFLPKNEEKVIQDKKIEIRLIKEKKWKTYIFNLEHFLPTDPNDKNSIDNVTKRLKKGLGTACTKKKTDNFGEGYSFNGDLREKVKQYLIDNKIVGEDSFK